MKQQLEYDVVKCFGHPSRRNDRCIQCEYHQSCNFFYATSKSVKSRSRLTSYENVQSWLLDSADFEHIPGVAEEEAEQSSIVAMLSYFFRYLITLDDYTVGIICQVINSGDAPGSCTVAELGKAHGCSRQAMHRKILDIIAGKPELSALLQGTMYKLSRGRQRFISRNRRTTPAGN